LLARPTGLEPVACGLEVRAHEFPNLLISLGNVENTGFTIPYLRRPYQAFPDFTQKVPHKVPHGVPRMHL
jgi:hypothetical protein